MPRIARAVATGFPHHVIQRGNNREKVFFTASANALEAGAFWGTTTATAGSAIAVGLTGASSFATTAHAYAIWACRNVSD